MKRMRVLCPVSIGNGKTLWRTLGNAFPNRDGSMNVYLDSLPVNGKLQLRPWDEQPPWEKKDGHGAASSSSLFADRGSEAESEREREPF
jgi:hypothetical protein